MEFDSGSGRYQVQLNGGAQIALRPANFTQVPRPGPSDETGPFVFACFALKLLLCIFRHASVLV